VFLSVRVKRKLWGKGDFRIRERFSTGTEKDALGKKGQQGFKGARPTKKRCWRRKQKKGENFIAGSVTRGGKVNTAESRTEYQKQSREDGSGFRRLKKRAWRLSNGIRTRSGLALKEPKGEKRGLPGGSREKT